MTVGQDGIHLVEVDKRLGGSVCVHGCPEGANAIAAKPEFSIPPKDMKALITALKAGRSGGNYEILP